jgi:DNA polymerase III subunit gamma/tau
LLRRPSRAPLRLTPRPRQHGPPLLFPRPPVLRLRRLQRRPRPHPHLLLPLLSQLPAAAPPSDSAAVDHASDGSPAGSPSGPIAASPLATGDLDAAAVRRIWDDVLEVAKRLKRRTHALLLSGPAQVVDVRANVLVVGFASGPVERQFNTGDNVEILQVALKEVLGVDWRIETTLSGPAATAAAMAESDSVAKPLPPLPTPSQSMAADRAPSRSAAARAAANEPKEPRVRRAAETAASIEIVLDEPNPDDDDADDGTSGLALLQRHLGATVIGDGETP